MIVRFAQPVQWHLVASRKFPKHQKTAAKCSCSGKKSHRPLIARNYFRFSLVACHFVHFSWYFLVLDAFELVYRLFSSMNVLIANRILASAISETTLMVYFHTASSNSVVSALRSKMGKLCNSQAMQRMCTLWKSSFGRRKWKNQLWNWFWHKLWHWLLLQAAHR